MGTTFTHFNPLSDENGHDLFQRFEHQIKSISKKTPNVYIIYILDDADKCLKWKIDTPVTDICSLRQTPMEFFKYIFGNVLTHYIDDPAYKNMSEQDLSQISKDFIEHLKTTSINVSTLDFEQESFCVKFPNNMFSKCADKSKMYFTRNINQDSNLTVFYYFPIMLEEKSPDTYHTDKYHVIIGINTLFTT